MTDTRLDIITSFPPETPSLKNLRQGVDAADESWEIHVHQLQRPELPGQNKLISAVEYGLLTLLTLWTGIRLYWKNDLLIIHKPLHAELIEALSGIIISERVFLSYNTVVYSTFDANYVHNPEKSALLFERADLVYVTSREIEQEVKKHTTRERIAFIPLSIDTELFEPDRSSRCSGDEVVLGWVGNIDVHRDNVQLLADAFSSIDTDSIKLRLLYGSETFPPDLKQQLQDTGVTLDLIDFVPHNEVPAIINTFDIGAAPLRDTEFNRGRSSVKIREYMACGVPVIASEVGENPYLIPDDTGFLVENPEDWQDALETLSDQRVHREMGKNAREHVVANFSTPVIAERVRAEFQELL